VRETRESVAIKRLKVKYLYVHLQYFIGDYVEALLNLADRDQITNWSVSTTTGKKIEKEVEMKKRVFMF